MPSFYIHNHNSRYNPNLGGDYDISTRPPGQYDPEKDYSPEEILKLVASGKVNKSELTPAQLVVFTEALGQNLEQLTKQYEHDKTGVQKSLLRCMVMLKLSRKTSRDALRQIGQGLQEEAIVQLENAANKRHAAGRLNAIGQMAGGAVEAIGGGLSLAAKYKEHKATTEQDDQNQIYRKHQEKIDSGKSYDLTPDQRNELRMEQQSLKQLQEHHKKHLSKQAQGDKMDQKDLENPSKKNGHLKRIEDEIAESKANADKIKQHGPAKNHQDTVYARDQAQQKSARLGREANKWHTLADAALSFGRAGSTMITGATGFGANERQYEADQYDAESKRLNLYAEAILNTSQKDGEDAQSYDGAFQSVYQELVKGDDANSQINAQLARIQG